MVNSIEHVLKDGDITVECVRVLPIQIAIEIKVDNPNGVGHLTEADLLAMLDAIKTEEKGSFNEPIIKVEMKPYDNQ